MPVGNWNVEFLNLNAQRRYPLADDASGLDGTATFQLPNSFLVELDMPIHAGTNVGPVGFFVQNVAAYSGGYGITIGYTSADESVTVTVATALIPRNGFTRNAVFTLGGVGDFTDTVGKVVIGKLDDIDEQPPGFWEFSLSSARIDPDTVRPILRGISSITCVNGDQRSMPLYGDIELVAGQNMQLVPIVQDGADPIIRINAISGEGTVETCVCEGDATPSPPITKINGVAPTSSGNLTITGNDCLQIETVANGIRLVDVCSQPCCGCAELERITNDLQRLSQQAQTVETFVSQLQTAVDTMGLTVLGSRINDQSCATA